MSNNENETNDNEEIKEIDTKLCFKDIKEEKIEMITNRSLEANEMQLNLLGQKSGQTEIERLQAERIKKTNEVFLKKDPTSISLEEVHRIGEEIKELDSKILAARRADAPEAMARWMKSMPEIDSKISKKLKNKFGHKKLFNLQQAAIKACLAGKDILLVSATGSGKSLIYQLSGLISKGMTIIIQPLKALIKDQMNILRKNKISVEEFHGDLSKDEQRRVLNVLETNPQSIKLLYVTPDMLSSKRIKRRSLLDILSEMNQRKLISRFVFDEAHCVTKNYREKAYFELELRDKFPDIPILAVTAAVVTETISEIESILKLKGDHIYFKGNLNRPNIRYEVRPRSPKLNKKDMSEITRFLTEKHKKDCGIIFCRSIDNCKTFSEYLNNHKFKAGVFYADLAEKDEIHQKWKRDEIKIIVGTIAFGMGIDKPNVRFVIHYNTPESIETYYQESGRAGRDNKPSDSIVYYHYTGGFPNDKEKVLRKKEKELSAMRLYCLRKDQCRRATLLESFQEKIEKPNCGTCDVCCASEKFRRIDAKIFAITILQTIAELSKAGINAAFKSLWGLLDGTQSEFSQYSSFGFANTLGYTEEQFEELTILLHQYDIITETRNGSWSIYKLSENGIDWNKVMNSQFLVQIKKEEEEETNSKNKKKNNRNVRRKSTRIRKNSQRRSSTKCSAELDEEICSHSKSPDEDDEGPLWVINKIMAYNSRTKKYKVKWAPTWEEADMIERDVTNLAELLKKFKGCSEAEIVEEINKRIFEKRKKSNKNKNKKKNKNNKKKDKNNNINNNDDEDEEETTTIYLISEDEEEKVQQNKLNNIKEEEIDSENEEMDSENEEEEENLRIKEERESDEDYQEEEEEEEEEEENQEREKEAEEEEVAEAEEFYEREIEREQEREMEAESMRQEELERERRKEREEEERKKQEEEERRKERENQERERRIKQEQEEKERKERENQERERRIGQEKEEEANNEREIQERERRIKQEQEEKERKDKESLKRKREETENEKKQKEFFTKMSLEVLQKWEEELLQTKRKETEKETKQKEDTGVRKRRGRPPKKQNRIE